MARIKRWTDGIPWSPTHKIGKFFISRELREPFPPGEPKVAIKQDKLAPSLSDVKQLLFGSLVGSYNFQENGSVKKIYSKRVGDKHYQLVSYYTMEDIIQGRLKTLTELQ